MERRVRMRKKIISWIICALIITTIFLVITPRNTNASSPKVEYQVSCTRSDTGETWSPLVSDGAVATVTSNQLGSSFGVKITAPGNYIEYQIGTIRGDYNEMWSSLASDGSVANVPTNMTPTTLMIKIISPGCNVEYQIGTIRGDYQEYWSPWVSNGEVAQITSNMTPMTFSLKATLESLPSPSIDIDPNTLNLKSKGRWITCYINLNEPYDVNNIDISTILLEDTIPAEWGDIQGDTLMVKFDRSEVEDMLSVGSYNLKVTGELTDGTSFEGYSDEIRVIDPGK
jgi:hypothetical protein